MDESAALTSPWPRTWLKPAYLVLGMFLAHILHVSRFYLAGWPSMRAFPDWDISLSLSFWLRLLLVPALTGLLLLVRR